MVTILFLGDVRADMGFPGLKRIDQRVCFDNLGDYPNYAFFLTPTAALEEKKGVPAASIRGNGFPLRPETGKVHELGYAVRFHFDWVILAVPRRQLEEAGDALDWNAGAANATGVLRSNTFKFPDYDDALVISPHEYNVHHFHIDVSNGQLTATRTHVEGVSFEVGSYRVPAWLVGLLMTLAIVYLGVWWLRRRARRAKMRASESG
jgi:hypothetical protein